MTKSEFYMVLPSNSCPLNHPNNTAANFKVEFENPIYFKGQWEVALQEFSFVYTPFEILSKSTIEWGIEENIKSAITVDLTDDIIDYKGSESISVTRFYGIHGFGEDERIAINSNNKFTIKFRSLSDAKALGFLKIEYTSYASDVVAERHHNMNKKIVFDVEEKKLTKEIFVFKDNIVYTELDELLTYMKEITSKIFKTFELGNRCKFSIKDHIKYVHFSQYLAQCLGLEKQRYDNVKDKVFVGVRKPKVSDSYHNMLIYCSIVNPIIVGDAYVPLLKSIWFEKFEPDEVANIIIENAMYLPISTSCINNIEINIRDDSGKFIKFAKDTKTSLTLHFRKAINDG